MGIMDKIIITQAEADAAEALATTEVKPVHDPLEFEKKMVEEEKKRLEAEPDQEEIACMMLKLYTPRFNRLVDQLSNRQLRRVMKSLVEFPLGKDYKHNDKTEQECFQIGQGLMDAKMVLVIKTYNDNKDHIVSEAAKTVANEAKLEYIYTEPVELTEHKEESNEIT